MTMVWFGLGMRKEEEEEEEEEMYGYQVSHQ